MPLQPWAKPPGAPDQQNQQAYSWPAELDLMAGQAGLRLAGRYAGWDRRPFTAASDSHVSVYQPS